MELEGLGELALHIILLKSGPENTAAVACVSKKFRDIASGDSLWFNFCSHDLDLSAPLDPLGNPTPSFKIPLEVNLKKRDKHWEMNFQGNLIRASAVFIPELCDLEHESKKYFFSYSIRMCLLPEGCIINRMSFSSCQLYWRHWIICANDVVVADVGGEAVIGKFPLLHPGEKEFVYESWTHMPSLPGSFEGSFTFVPGRLADPKGGPFEVEVARFPLQLPDYIF
ncbi:hypothetical protein L1049_016949 [Liquidambar formosana]|uniref:ApaG domain-containing protein n=1 Tax=Liquidambar formosana TaxID=63359 RepID=A0AAP0X7V6_LIQFO